MPQQTKIFRVFVSSTFADMKEERELLQKSVFPQLEKFCEERGAKFQAVDLRWGVNEESQLNQKTLDICLNEIARCQRISPKPNFLILLGDRYGWQPIPAKIPQDEMKEIVSRLTPDGKTLLDQWYRLDENALPPEYVLQAREGDHKEYSNWEQIEVQIRNVLRNAVESLTFTAAQRIKYFTSATHQEIIDGALNPPESAERPEEHVFAFSRHINGLPDDMSAQEYIDVTGEKPDFYCKKMLTGLKEELAAKLGNHFVPYSAAWQEGRSIIDDPDAFINNVYTFFKDIIEQQIKEVISPDEIDHEARLHGEFKARLTEHFQGREEILEKIRAYLSDPERRIFSLIGASGSGKSSVMAEAIRRFEEKNSSTVLVYRFIGTTSSSSNIMSLLQSVCGQIVREFDMTLEALAGEGNEKALTELNGLIALFSKCIALATAQKSITIFLDALDQLSETDNTKLFHWLVKKLPEHAKIVVSALPELAWSLSGTYIEHLPLLPILEAKQILYLWFKSIQRKLTPDQYTEITKKFAKTSLPIFLRLAFERTRHWHSYDLHEVLQEDVLGIVNGFLNDLEKEHTKELSQHILSYMLCGRYGGLAEDEILEILVFDREFWEKIFLPNTRPEYRQALAGETKLPTIVWSRLFLDLEPFLTERDAHGVSIITVFHRQFIEVLKERYIAICAAERHATLAAYFSSKPAWLDKSRKTSNVRRAAELVFQQRMVQDWTGARSTLLDQQFVLAKCVAGLVMDLDADYRTLLEEAPEGSLSDRETLHLIHGALCLSLHVVAKDSTQFASQLVGRLLSYRCKPEVLKFVEELSAGAPRPWLRPMQPCFDQPGGALLRTLVGHKSSVEAVTVTPDGRRAVSGSYDKTLKVWELATGAELLTIHSGDIITVVVTPDGRIAVSGSMDKTLNVWDLEMGEVLRTFPNSFGRALAISPDGRMILSSLNMSIKVLDIETGAELHTLVNDSEINAIAVTSDGRIVVSGSMDKTLNVWDLESGEVLRTFPNSFGRALAISPDGRTILSSLNMSIKVLDIETGAELHTLVNDSEANAIAVTSDGRIAVSDSWKNTLKVWDLKTGENLYTYYGHLDSVTSIAVISDGRFAVSASKDNTLKVWDLEVDVNLPTIDSKKFSIEVVMSNGQNVLTCSGDGTVRVWHLETGRALYTLGVRPQTRARAFAITPDGRRMIMGLFDGKLKAYDSEMCVELSPLEGHTDRIYTVTLTADGRRAISGSADNTIKVWDLGTGTQLHALSCEGVTVVAMTPDGRRAVSDSFDNTLKVWDVEEGVMLHSLAGHTKCISAIAVTPDGRRAISGSADNTLKVWDLDAGEEVRSLEAVWDMDACKGFHSRKGRVVPILSLAVTSDARCAASSGSGDQKLKIWDLKTDILITTFHCNGIVTSFTFASPDRIVAGDSCNSIYFLAFEE